MYAGTTFYRVISDVTVQGGAIDGGKSGKTGKSSSLHDGNPFEPDNYDLKHSTLGLVSMVRGVGGSVDSRFFINTAPGEFIYQDCSILFQDNHSKTSLPISPLLFRFFFQKDAGWADDRYAAFGIVEEGMDFISAKMNKVKVQPPSNTPIDPIRIVKSGVL